MQANTKVINSILPNFLFSVYPFIPHITSPFFRRGIEGVENQELNPPQSPFTVKRHRGKKRGRIKAGIYGWILKSVCIFFSFSFLVACNNDQTYTAQENEQVIRFGVTSAPVTLDPLFATDATSSRINRLIYQRLVDFGEDNLPIPGIANWQLLNNRHFRFTLNQNNTFHHGKLLTTADIKATYEALLDKKKASPHRGALKHIQRIEIIDEKTIDFFLERDDPLFPAFLAVGIVPSDLLKKDHPFNQQPVGSGQFAFEQWPYEEQLLLRRQTDQQLVEFLKVKDPTVRVLKLLRGELDIIQNNLPPEHIAYLKQNSEVDFITQKGSNYSYLGFNLTDKITSQQTLRQAIAYALNRDKIIQYALGQAAKKANGFFPPYHWAGADLVEYQYDRVKARQLMKSLGYSETNRLAISYKTSSDPFRIRIATIIQDQLKDIFIDVDIRSYDWGTFYGDIKKGKFQLYSLTWVGIKTPDIFRYVYHSDSLPPGGANRGRLINADIDRLIEQAEQEQNIKQQAKLYQQVQQRLHELLPYVSLWYEDNIAFFRNNIQGFSVSVDGNYDGLSQVTRSDLNLN